MAAALAVAAGGAVAATAGDYDQNHKWHDSGWWFHNNPDWVWQHHPEWIRENASWTRDGDWDAQHHWHARTWWMQNNPSWVHQHHPDWH